MNDDRGLTVYTVFHNPLDFPGKWVARGSVIAAGKVTPLEQPAYVGDSLHAARQAIQTVSPGLVRLPRDPHDEPQIVEVWL